jgi:CrcB protein
LGVLCRYGIDVAVLAGIGPSSFPWSTFGINLVGSLLAGLLFGLGPVRQLIPPEFQVGLMVGFLGGFTTFSAYALQTARLLSSEPATAIAYWALSPVLGLAMAWVGLKVSGGG